MAPCGSNIGVKACSAVKKTVEGKKRCVKRTGRGKEGWGEGMLYTGSGIPRH